MSWCRLCASSRRWGIRRPVPTSRGGGPIESVVEAKLTPDIQALLQLGSPLTNQAGDKIAAVLAQRRLPGISPFRTFPDGGGLRSYGVDLLEMYRRLVPFVVKVLRCAKPDDIPIEQPVKFELVVNVKTAKALGLTVPPKLLLSANEVIN